MMEILSSTALATVQDAGRLGSLRYGVGTAGAMDQLALAVGNLLLGNDPGAAALEIPVCPFQVRFTEDCAFALTGADGQARLDQRAIAPWWVSQARKGQVLTIAPPVAGSGSRAYLALAGGIDVPEVLASRSTQLRAAFGGFEGRAVRRGDVLRAATPGVQPAVDFGVVPPAIGLPQTCDGLPAMRVLPAAEYAGFQEESRAAFWAGEWKITAQSDRYGYRMQGTPLVPVAAMEIRSHGIVPGVIQVPPGGQPIVQMRDAQPSGGYPKFGTVIEADLWRLGQAAIGSRVRFVETDYEDAVAALDEVQAWLDEVRRMVDLQRWALQRT
jgi:biotin-dependent carboxylase-like uncharacterized protein